MFVLCMMLRPGAQLHVAQLLQLAADAGLVERDGKFVIKPLGQVDQPPAHHPVNRWDGTAFDNIDQCLSLRIVQPRAGAGRFAAQKSIGPMGIEPDHPVPHDLKPNAADPGR